MAPTSTIEKIEKMPATATPPKPVVIHFRTAKVWTAARIAPIVGVFVVAIGAVALKPNVTGSLIVVAAQILLMGALVKTWLSH